MSPSYTISHLPRSFNDTADDVELLKLIVERYKSIRLESLQTNPEAFSSTYSRELAFGPKIWEQRLKNPAARTFVAVESGRVNDWNGSEQSSMIALYKMPWIGTTTLLGPIVTYQAQMPFNPTIQLYDSFFKAPCASEEFEKQDDVSGTRVVLYAVNAVYVSPPARGEGIGRQLLHAVLDAAKLDLARHDTDQAMCICFVEKDNDAALALYIASGFEIAGAEDYVAHNGRNGSVYALIKSLADL